MQYLTTKNTPSHEDSKQSAQGTSCNHFHDKLCEPCVHETFLTKIRAHFGGVFMMSYEPAQRLMELRLDRDRPWH